MITAEQAYEKAAEILGRAEPFVPANGPEAAALAHAWIELAESLEGRPARLKEQAWAMWKNRSKDDVVKWDLAPDGTPMEGGTVSVRKKYGLIWGSASGGQKV